jgi:hypothetical protein
VDHTPPSASPQSQDTVRALVGEFLDQKKVEVAEKSAVEATQRLRKVLGVLAFVACGAVWILPSFFGPSAPRISPDQAEAGARMTLFLAGERLWSFRRTHGTLPRSLAAAFVDSTGLTYSRGSDSTFELSTDANGNRIIYRSTMRNADLLGPSLRILSAAP